METRELSKPEARAIILRQVETQLARSYPTLSPLQRKRYADKAVRKAWSQMRANARAVIVTERPANRWQELKSRYAPAWLLRISPVRTIEA